ncbi:DUF2742 domain-containing protein [Gordonia metallireducens]|uniref:DUF2742 domain-containing protein n=1 Tax=Gordonia metallireducens TaxID=2897779 RepID=UPI001E5B868A|nr:DUF2742 domain-containing protein [Gordonia metallireducens]
MSVIPILSSVSEIRAWHAGLHGEHGLIFTAPSSSREVSWTATHERLDPVIRRAARHGAFPAFGTHDWLDLTDGDPRLVGSVYLAASMYALHLESRSQATAEASREVSTAQPWAARFRTERQRQAWLEANSWAKRVVA